MTVNEEIWVDMNQRYLTTALANMRATLERHAAGMKNNTILAEATPEVQFPSEEMDQRLAPAALEILCATFGLSPFEREILLLCAGMELNTSFATLCADAQGDPACPYPTFSLALAALNEPHRSALAPDAPLRRWRLIEIDKQAGTLLMTSPLRIDERILHFLAGIQHLDERLVGLIEPVQAGGELVLSHMALVERIEIAWTRADGQLPLIQLCGNDETSKRTIAAACCAKVGLHLFSLSTDSIPQNSSELVGLMRLFSSSSNS